MKFRARKSIRIGSPRFCVKFNFTQSGYTGWGVKVWRWTYSNRTKRQTFDTPGWGAVHWGSGKPAKRKRGES